MDQTSSIIEPANANGLASPQTSIPPMVERCPEDIQDEAALCAA